MRMEDEEDEEEEEENRVVDRGRRRRCSNKQQRRNNKRIFLLSREGPKKPFRQKLCRTLPNHFPRVPRMVWSLKVTCMYMST